MPRNTIFPGTIGLLFLLLFSLNPAKSAGQNPIEFPAAYRFHAGDSLHWAAPEFNDSTWSQVPMNQFPFEQWQGSGWFRIQLKVDSTLRETPMALMLSLGGAVQVYLDGVLLHTVGKVGDSRENEHAVVYKSPRFHPIVFRAHEKTTGQSTHLLVLRYSSFFLKQPAWSGEQPTLYIGIEPLQSAVQAMEKELRNRTTHQMLISGISITLAILHLALFLFYRLPRANLYFGLIALGFALNVFFDVQGYFSTTPGSVLWSLRLNYTGSLIMILAIIRLTHSLYYQKPQYQFYGIAILGTVLIAATWFRPLTSSIYGQLFLVGSVLEILRTILVSWLRKRAMLLQGAWIIGIGLGLTILSVIYKKMGDFGFSQTLSSENYIPLDRYGILCLLASISIFLAYNFARINKKIVVQEMEQKLLEAENARKSKELEEARQLQLSMLPKDPPSVAYLEISADMKTATEVGGDYYDFHLADDGTLTIAIGDATGHGMKAGTMVSVIKSLFIAEASQTDILTFFKICTQTIKQMRLGNLYMAMMLIKIKDHKMTASSAGIPPIYIYRSETKSVEEIVIKGMPLGGSASFPYKQRETNLAPGDTMLLMSDGFPELFNDKDEMLDFPRVKEIFKETADKSADEIIAHLNEAGERWSNGRPQDDDITFVVLKVKHSRR